mgnify:CR=1 FL=1
MDLDVHTYLPEDLLVKVDVATMAHGLEGRSPFLDHDLMEFAASLPERLKLRAVIVALSRFGGYSLLNKVLRGVGRAGTRRAEVNHLLDERLCSVDTTYTTSYAKHGIGTRESRFLAG